jgi:hypothetical protein
MQVNVKVVFAVIAGEVAVPAVVWMPDQPPEAVHDVAFWLDQVSVTVPPEATLAALLCSVTVGAGGAGPTVIA